jgi:hypothetical protein
VKSKSASRKKASSTKKMDLESSSTDSEQVTEQKLIITDFLDTFKSVYFGKLLQNITKKI